jgi:hypothetical protein
MRKSLPLLARLSLGIGCAVAFAANPAFAVFYDIDFGTPPHTVGLPPAVGAGPPPRDTVSSINFGTPTVVSAFGVLTDQPCEFDSFDNQGDQIQLNLNDLPSTNFYTMDCDLVVADISGSNGEYVILFDTPTVRTIRFLANGDIVVFVPGDPTVTIGTYTFGSLIHVRSEIDLGSDSWRIFLNNVPVHAGSFGGAVEIVAIRFSTNVTTNPPGVSAGLDNVLVDEMTPTAVERESWAAIKAMYR